MKPVLVSISYFPDPNHHSPEQWLSKAFFSTRFLEELSAWYDVHEIKSIGYQGEYNKNGVHYHFIKGNSISYKLTSRLHKIVKSVKPHIVLVNGTIFPLQILLLKLQVKGKYKIVVQHRANSPLQGLKGLYQQVADRYIEQYFFSSKEIADSWVKAKQITANKVYALPGGSSDFCVTDKFKAKQKTDVADGLIYLFVGHLNKNKDPLTVVDAFEKFIRLQSNAHLYIVFQDDDLLPAISERLNTNKQLSDHVHLIGNVPRQEMTWWYNAADFIISASYNESFGLAVCEGISCGCIPIVSNIPSFRAMTDNFKYGYSFEPGDVDTLLATLKSTSLLDIQNEKRKIVEYFHNYLSYKKVAEKFYLLQQLSN